MPYVSKFKVNKMFYAEKKLQYWDHFTDEALRSFRPKKITDIRLKQIKKIVLNGNFLWQKVISRYHALDITPSELKETSPSNYNQGACKFLGNDSWKNSASISRINRIIRQALTGCRIDHRFVSKKL